MSPKQKRFLRRVAVMLGVLTLALGVIDYYCIDLFGGVFIPITATFHYRHILAWLHRSGYPTDSDVLAFFPKAIPDHSVNTRMYFVQLPGDFDFELRCKLPADEVKALVGRVAPVALVSGHAGDEMTDAMSSRNEWIDPRYFNLADGPGLENMLPPSYVVYLTHVGYSKINSREETMYETGIAVDWATNDVIYWLKAHAWAATATHSPTGVTPR